MSARPVRLQDIQAITFDCYGTLIDWEGGAKQTLRELLQKKSGGGPFDPASQPGQAGGTRRRQAPALPEQLLDDFFRAWEQAQWERIQQSYARYRDITADCFAQVAARHGLPLGVGEALAFADAIATWKPFPDVPAALGKLKPRVRLGIISNIDDDILAASVQPLGIEFDLLMTAEQARAYKPSLLPFQRALERLGLPAAQVAHAAFGFEYDIGPATQLGFRTILVRRTRAKFPPTPVPDLIVRDLAELAAQFE